MAAKELPIPDIRDMIKKITVLNKHSSKMGAFAAILYITACRIHEVLNYKYKYFDENTKKMIVTNIQYPGIRVKDLQYIWKTSKNETTSVAGEKQITEETTPTHLIIRSRVEKLKKGKLEWKQGNVVLNEKNVYAPLILIIDNYVNEVCRKPLHEFTSDDYIIYGDSVLFTFSYEYANRIIRRCFGEEANMHWIRLVRIKHLIDYHGYKFNDLQQYIRWKSIESSLAYTKVSNEDLLQKMLDTDIVEDDI